MQNSALYRLFAAQPLIRDLPVEAAQAVLALRYCILCRRSDRDPMPELERRWGNILAARRFGLVVEAVGQIWPDPFAVAPPCCPRLSFDESLLASITAGRPRSFRLSDGRDAEQRCTRPDFHRARKFRPRQGARPGAVERRLNPRRKRRHRETGRTPFPAPAILRAALFYGLVADSLDHQRLVIGKITAREGLQIAGRRGLYLGNAAAAAVEAIRL